MIESVIPLAPLAPPIFPSQPPQKAQLRQSAKNHERETDTISLNEFRALSSGVDEAGYDAGDIAYANSPAGVDSTFEVAGLVVCGPC